MSFANVQPTFEIRRLALVLDRRTDIGGILVISLIRRASVLEMQTDNSFKTPRCMRGVLWESARYSSGFHSRNNAPGCAKERVHGGSATCVLHECSKRLCRGASGQRRPGDALASHLTTEAPGAPANRQGPLAPPCPAHTTRPRTARSSPRNRAYKRAPPARRLAGRLPRPL